MSELNQIHSCARELSLLDDELKSQEESMFSEAFKLSFDGDFATINGFRLGKLSKKGVSTQEINSALGCVVHMLEVLAMSSDYEFKHCKPITRGSFSKMRLLSTKPSQSHEDFELFLHSKSDIPNQFDRAIVCLLACIRELETRLPEPLKYT
jgi:beclin 1